jgi:hypothetical protein
MEGTPKIKVFMCVLPFSGHYIPLLRIADALDATGRFAVRIASSSFEIPKMSRQYPKLSMIPLEDPNQALVEHILEQTELPFIYYKDVWTEQLHRCLTENRPDVVVVDAFSYSSYEASTSTSYPYGDQLSLFCIISRFAGPTSPEIQYLDRWVYVLRQSPRIAASKVVATDYGECTLLHQLFGTH